MMQVVFDEELQGDGRFVCHRATCCQRLIWNSIHDGSQDLVFDIPPDQQGRPGPLGVAMSCYPCFLLVVGTVIDAAGCGADKTLAVVGGGIQHVADDLLAGPTTFTPGNVSKFDGSSDQRLLYSVQAGAKLDGKR